VRQLSSLAIYKGVTFGRLKLGVAKLTY